MRDAVHPAQVARSLQDRQTGRLTAISSRTHTCGTTGVPTSPVVPWFLACVQKLEGIHADMENVQKPRRMSQVWNSTHIVLAARRH